MSDKLSLSSIRVYFPTLCKYLFSVIASICTCFATDAEMFAFVGVLELVIIFSITNYTASFNLLLGNVFNVILLLLFNIETIVLCISGEHIRLIMLENIPSFRSLSGDFFLYFVIGSLLIVFTFIPIKHIPVDNLRLLSLSLAFELIITLFVGNYFSTLFSVKLLYDEYKQVSDLSLDIEGQPDMTAKFYHEGVMNYTDIAPENIDQYNIVLLFIEGLSQNIIDDEREIMSNAKSLESESINFTNYFNHTAATHRGIISQLYSGYQRQNLDKNSLISLQSILSSKGYRTAFINTEPKNHEFSRYLNALGFDEMITDSQLDGYSKSISDKHAFELLYASMEEYGHDDSPFFISMYTFGTHNTFDSTDEKYMDGSDRVLNKFYNLDYQLGLFLEKYQKSSFKDDTIIIFTTDHCTYNSQDFRAAFPDYHRTTTFLDTIPLCIYYNGVEHEDIDVLGRNSLCLAPTILDLLNISEPNYFLGSSLFNPEYINESIENVYWSDEFLTSQAGVAKEIDGQRLETYSVILSDYFIATQQKPSQ